MFTKSSIGVSIVALSVATVLSACTPPTIKSDIDPGYAEEAHAQREMARKMHNERVERLSRVSWPLLTKNLELCPNEQTYKLGIAYVRHEDGGGITIRHVIHDSPAYSAGMQKDDRITHINGTDLGSGKGTFAEVLQEHLAREVIDPIILRSGSSGSSPQEYKEYTVLPEPACDYAVILGNRFGTSSGALKADASSDVLEDVRKGVVEGEKVYITPEIMRFIKHDHELALVIGRELARKTEEHLKYESINALLGGILGAVVAKVSGDNIPKLLESGAVSGFHMFPEEFEESADYVGVYYAARAGYDVSCAAWLWRRVAIEHPEGIDLLGGPHPSTAKRFLSIDRAVGEIEMKRKNKLPLIPFDKTISLSVRVPRSASRNCAPDSRPQSVGEISLSL